MHKQFWWENVTGRDHSEDLGVDGKIILEWILGTWVGRCGLDLFQDRDQWWAVVNTIKAWEFLD
jgi:hypothetical protein